MVLVHFGATWSGPNRKVQQILKDMSLRQEFQHVVFAEVDVDRL